MLSFSGFLIERPVVAYRELERVHKVATILQAAIIHQIRNFVFTVPVSPSVLTIENYAIPDIWKHFDAPAHKISKVRIILYRSGEGGSISVGGNEVRFVFKGLLGKEMVRMTDADREAWKLDVEKRVKDATELISHEVTHLFQYVKDDDFHNVPRVAPYVDRSGYLNSKVEVEAIVSGYLAVFDKITRQQPTLLAGVKTFDEMISVVSAFSRHAEITQIYKAFSPRNKKKFEIAFRKFLRDRRQHFAKFLDPVWFD